MHFELYNISMYIYNSRSVTQKQNDQWICLILIRSFFVKLNFNNRINERFRSRLTLIESDALHNYYKNAARLK